MVIVWHDGGQWSDVPCNYHLSYTCKMGLGKLPRAAARRLPGRECSPAGATRSLSGLSGPGGSPLQRADPPPILAVQCGPPPALSNARALGKPKQRYEIGSAARYRCRPGLAPRRSPVIRCREDGTWEPPQLACRPGECRAPPEPTEHPGALSLHPAFVSPPGVAQPPNNE